MQTVTILRDLWRLRLVVVLAGIVSLMAGFSVAFKPASLEPRRYEVGVATARVLVDTPQSQVIEVAPKGSEALGVRANLLANLMVHGELVAEIAKDAGVDPEKLDGIAESAAAPTGVATPHDPRGHSLTTRVVASTDGDLPIIEVEARAPDGAKATVLATAAVAGLTDYLDSKAALEHVADGSRLQVSGLGEPQAGVEAHGPGLMIAIALALFLFVGACAAILGLFALIRAWKDMTAAEQLDSLSRDHLVVLDDELGLSASELDQDAGADLDDTAAWTPPDSPPRQVRSGSRRAPRDAA